MAAEIEVLVKIESGKEELLSFLSENGKLREQKEVRDIYYFDPLRRNLKPDKDGRLYESMRLRDKEGSYTITHKIDFFDDAGRWTYSDENETSVSSLNDAMSILKNLGLKQLTRVNVRKTYFEIDQYEIAVEDVERLGTFLEVEYKGIVSGDHMNIKSTIEEFVSRLPCTTSRDFDGGKPELMIAAIGIDEDDSSNDQK